MSCRGHESSGPPFNFLEQVSGQAADARDLRAGPPAPAGLILGLMFLVILHREKGPECTEWSMKSLPPEPDGVGRVLYARYLLFSMYGLEHKLSGPHTAIFRPQIFTKNFG